MREPDFLGLFVEPLEDLRVPYMITGAVASAIYGEPRFTRDIDIVLELRRSDVKTFSEAFPEEAYYVPPAPTLREEIARSSSGHFNLIHQATALRADIYLRGDDPLHGWAFERRRRIDVDDVEAWVAPIEYVVLRKLEYFRSSGSDRHLRDVSGMMRVSEEIVDWDELQGWTDRLDLEEALEAARSYGE